MVAWRAELWSNNRVGVLQADQRALLRVLAGRIVPESAALDEAAQEDCLGLIDDVLATRPAPMQRQFATFLRVVRWLPVLRYGRPIDRLAPKRQDAALRFFQHFPVQVVRAGFWGVRTLILMGFYARPGTAATIGYRPTTNGNADLHARTPR